MDLHQWLCCSINNLYHSKCFTVDYVMTKYHRGIWRCFLMAFVPLCFKIGYHSCWMVFHLWWFVTSTPYLCDINKVNHKPAWHDIIINYPPQKKCIIYLIMVKSSFHRIQSQMCCCLDVPQASLLLIFIGPGDKNGN